MPVAQEDTSSGARGTLTKSPSSQHPMPHLFLLESQPSRQSGSDSNSFSSLLTCL